ncbi:MAG: GGDEF domain-containing protein [Gammaproteobacteria bacterium]|nr:MAG: GGDEF domain-containing protein [Gammaproteobacteria bacterium]
MKISPVKSLQSKIFILFVVLLLIVQVVSFFTTYQANRKLEATQLSNSIGKAKALFDSQFTSRNYYLSAFVETVAKDYALKSVFQDDTKSFLYALNNHRKRTSANIAIAIALDGKIIGELVTYRNKQNKLKVRKGHEQGQIFSQQHWLIQDKSDNLYQLNEQVYQLSLAPLKSGGRTIGWIGFGYIINNNLADDFAKLTNVDISFVLRNDKTNTLSHVLASSSKQNDDAHDSFIKTLVNNNDDNFIYDQLTLGNINYNNLIAVMYKAKADVLKNIQADWWQLLVFFMLTLALSLIGAYHISAGITRPIKVLITQAKSIAQGNYNESVNISDSVELMQLADEFNHMKESVVTREQTISHRADHDSLTELPNRNKLLKVLMQRAQDPDAKQQQFLLLRLNIRRIKEVNNTLGHQVGDKVIMEVANRLKNCPINHQLFHLGSDEFIMLTEKQAADELLLTLMPSLDPLYKYENICLHLQYHLGLALSPEHTGEDVADILQKTNVALQYAKNNKSLYQLYDRQFDFNTIERLHLTNSLKTAIEESQLVLYYQPKISLKTLKVSHVEALVRWQHPLKGLVPPDDFISIAEQTGQMDALTRWVTVKAIEQFLAWQKQGIDINIAINISAENLKGKAYSDFVIALKERNNIADHAITLEVTEDAVVADPKQATEILTYLRDHGFKLSIDDYGTGYSSLAQLKQLPVHELKIDKSFVLQLMQDKDDQIIVKSTIELAHNMGLSVVAEGIEDEKTLLWLKAHHCELAQGFYMSKPLPSTAFSRWLSDCPYYEFTNKTS